MLFAVKLVPPVERDDFGLAQRCASGDRAAQSALFSQYRRQVHGILYRILGSNRELEDLVQDSFIQVFRSLERFRGESKLSTWIARITTRVALAHIRRRKPAHVELDSIPMPAAEGPSAAHRAEGRQAARRMYEVLDKLDAKQRVAFALHVIDERPLKEVASIMGASLVATKSRVWRARKEMIRRASRDAILASYLQQPRENEQ